MTRNRSMPPGPKGRSKDLLFNAETSVTSTDESEYRKPRSKRQKGERVEAPSAELIPQPRHDWSKISVYVALALAAAAAIYNYADLASLVRSTAEEVKDLKRRSEELLRSSLEVTARLGVLERRDSAQATATASSPAKPASR